MYQKKEGGGGICRDISRGIQVSVIPPPKKKKKKKTGRRTRRKKKDKEEDLNLKKPDQKQNEKI